MIWGGGLLWNSICDEKGQEGRDDVQVYLFFLRGAMETAMKSEETVALIGGVIVSGMLVVGVVDVLTCRCTKFKSCFPSWWPRSFLQFREK
jgi:hypothetical protein